MSIAKKFSLPLAGALAALVLSAPGFAQDYYPYTIDEPIIDSYTPSPPEEPNLWLVLVSVVSSIL